MADPPAPEIANPGAAQAPPPAAATPSHPSPQAAKKSLDSDTAQWTKGAAARLIEAAEAEGNAGAEPAGGTPETAEEPTQTEESTDEATEAEATPEAETVLDAKADKKPEPKRKTVEVDKGKGGEKLEQLKALTKELGLVFDGGKVSIKEASDFRDWKQAQRNTIARESADALQKIQAAQAQHQAELAEAQALKTIKESDDHEGLAKLMGYKSWDAYQEHLIQVRADPNYKALQQLREEREQEKAERERERHQLQAERQRAEKAAAENQWRTNLATELKDSPNKLCQIMHDDPVFISAVMNVQQEYWDGQSTIRPEVAVSAKRRGPTLEAQMRGLYDRLHRVFGEDAAEPAKAEAEPEATPEPEPAKPAKPGAKPKPKTAVVPASKTGGEPAANGKRTLQDWTRYGAAALARAAREEDSKH